MITKLTPGYYHSVRLKELGHYAQQTVPDCLMPPELRSLCVLLVLLYILSSVGSVQRAPNCEKSCIICTCLALSFWRHPDKEKQPRHDGHKNGQTEVW